MTTHTRSFTGLGRLAVLTLGAGWALAACESGSSDTEDGSGGEAGAQSEGSGGRRAASGGASTASGGHAAGGLGGEGGETGSGGGSGGDPGNVSACDDVECQDHAECVEDGDDTECACQPGYEDDGTGACVDIDECANTEEPACGPNANCQNSVGAFACACPESFTGDPNVFCCAPQPPAPIASSIVLSSGHIDVLAVAADCDNQAISVSTKDGTSDPVVYRQTDRVLIHGNQNAAITVPEGLQAGFEFLGPPGSIGWLLPESGFDAQAGGVPWAGFDAFAVSLGVYENDEVTLYLSSVEGPGRFVAFESPQDSSSPPGLLFDPDNGLIEMSIPPGLHRHLNWYFSEPGLYVLHFGVEATRVGGLTGTSAYQTVRFFLGDLADLPETEPPVLTIAGLSSPYVAGDTMELSVQRYGSPLPPLETTWLRQCVVVSGSETPELTDWTEAGAGSTLSYVLEEADFSCHFRAALFSGSIEVATSQSVVPSLW